MITFERIEMKSIYGGSYLMDNAYRIHNDGILIGVFCFSDPENNTLSSDVNDMYIEYINLEVKNQLRKVIKRIFEEFGVSKLVGEANEDNIKIWDKIGATRNESKDDEFREMFYFEINKN